MNNFLFDEQLTKEYRRDLLATAEKHNRHSHLFEKKIPSFIYKALLKLSATLH